MKALTHKMQYLVLCILIGIYSHTYAVDSNTNNTKKISTTQTKTLSTNSTVTNSSPKGSGYLPVNFDLLGGYEYRERLAINGVAVTNKADQIPQNVKVLNGKKVVIHGYFYPTQVETGGTIKDFLLLRNQIYCCFGDAVRINEWISVTMKDGETLKADFTSKPVTLYGTIEVGPKYEDDTLIDLYRIKADKLVEEK